MFQTYDRPPVAVRFCTCSLQVNVKDAGVMETAGGAKLLLMLEEAAAVQPLLVLVTVTRYIPAILILILLVLAPVLHW